MYLHIAPTRLISEVQKEFSTGFPFLKLEFFPRKTTLQSGLSVQKPVTHDRKIAEVQSSIIDGDLEINEEMKVQDLETIFKNEFGLTMQVFRRSGNLWLETTMTDNWTLRNQNEHGREISTVTTEKVNSTTDDYDLNRDSQR